MPFFAMFTVLLLAVLAYWLHLPVLFFIAQNISDIFINLLKFISLPLIFFSVIATMSSLENQRDIKKLVRKTLFYTLLTTIIAAVIGLFFYLGFSPAKSVLINDLSLNALDNIAAINGNGGLSYVAYLKSLIPTNFVKMFLDNNVIATIAFAFTLGFAIPALPLQQRTLLAQFFTAIFNLLLVLVKGLLKFMPVVIWAFVTLFLRDLESGVDIYPVFWYLLAVLAANLTQALIVLPALLLYKGISPWRTFSAVTPALLLAFFSKSSNGTLPTTIECVQNRLKVSKKVSSFTLPLCTTVNMNGCAAFIAITVLFVAELNGFHFSIWELAGLILLSTAGAFGNAGVPMGCYFMSITFLVSMNVPITVMGLILPLYTLIDMVETAINVWSDICVTQIVAKESSTLQLESELEV